ncbi:Protein CHLOROPLAST J-LIKE DOMAIN 1, chloroplastic [Trifolium repens]|nr:Chloroplast J domain [Trifolium repens]WJX85614.1 Protein CHLOROPLAST J-LIKE DOMAIN 1, chloroplastic [Trifolium repens]
MALAISNILHFPKFNNSRPQISTSLRFSNRTASWNNRQIISASASAAGSSNPNGDLNPYQILGVSPIEKFDTIKATYTKKKKEAENKGDEETASKLEKAYDKLMMAQLSNRKKGVTFGEFKVSKDIKYADKQPIIPWGPRFAKSSENDTRINLGIAAAFTAWIVVTRSADYKPLQFLAFAFVYRLFEKLKSFESPKSSTINEDGEDPGEGLRMGKRLLRSLALVFGCVAVSSLGYTFALNIIESASGYIPSLLYNSQELIITASSAVMLFILGSYYR